MGSRSYDTGAGQVPNGTNHDVVDERVPLLGNGQAKSRARRWRDEMMADVAHSWTDVVLLFCYLVTGLLDSSSIHVWNTFVSMQTGK